MFQPLGVVICSAIAFGFIPTYSCSPNFSEKNPLPSCRTAETGTPCCSRSNNMGWRYLLYTLGGLSLLVFFLRFFVFTFRETPKYSIYKGHDAKAIETMQHMAKVNKQQCRLTLEDLEALAKNHEANHSDTSSGLLLSGPEDERSSKRTGALRKHLNRYKMLFDGFQMTRLTILVWLTYIFDFWGFTVAGMCRCLAEGSIEDDPLTRCFSPRLLPPSHSRAQERCCLGQSQVHIRSVHIHIRTWNPRCSTRCLRLPHPSHRAQVDDGHFLRPHGGGHIPALDRRHCRQKRGPFHTGVLLSVHVQRRAVRVDAGGVPGAGPWDGLRRGQFLGSALWDCQPAYCAASVRSDGRVWRERQHQQRAVPRRRRDAGMRPYHDPTPESSDGDTGRTLRGGQEKLKDSMRSDSLHADSGRQATGIDSTVGPASQEPCRKLN